MSSGANIGDGGPEGIGDDPTDMGVWEKLQLGWLGGPGDPQGTWYDVAFAGERSEHELGPAEGATRNGKQALFVVLPDKEVPLELGAACTGCGSQYFYSGAGDDLNNSMAVGRREGAEDGHDHLDQEWCPQSAKVQVVVAPK